MDMAERVRRGVIGEGAVLDGPYGPRRLTYADYTASGRSLDFVEDAIRRHVLPLYGNTHTEASATGAHTTRLREQARRTIHRAVGGTDDDVVIFCGSGVTAAIDKLVALLGLRGGPGAGGGDRPLVLIGPYEHHSNELPWRESRADVLVVAERPDGHIDLADLRRLLAENERRPLIAGSFSAASNVTGVLSDTTAIARVLHEHGALSVFDYAAGGPYLEISMTGKDAVVLSPHKFPGGPQTPGVLVVRRELIPAAPTAPGGGTVAYVDPVGHRYRDDPVAREEAGTPAIVESIRAGLVFAVKEAVGVKSINAREHRLWRSVSERWRDEPRVRVLGPGDPDRLPIVSFQVAHGDRFLHHNFVVTLLNDLFGIQARGGCSCAGPYGHRLLGIDEARSRAFEKLIDAGWEGVKPGWARVGLNYFFTPTVAGYLADAVLFVARCGARFLPDYRFDPHTGRWRHRASPPPVSEIDLLAGGEGEELGEESLAGHLAEAYALAADRPEPADDGGAGLPGYVEELRWFVLPAVCLQ
ncbi:aminotransferase class V-fold PLP-dependent enzyme [Symbioplanes lichenis]|uniref:aminotransferase class V-fold PLP-dependent enzyme n=1 Tax=Symbioplanes lichenis TaxID=1629072 RepID=UPI0027392816|nr:aminotransferase class V-fold PLP-dependent enzyme [Actinoplanes lichenis]